MPAILVVAHAPLASALHAVAAHVYAERTRLLVALDVAPDAEPAAIESDIRAALERLDGGEALILTDMFGATPCNAARRVADGVRVRIVAGVNVPMLWRALCYVGLQLDELVARAVDGGTNGVMHVPPENRRQNQSNSSALHDQVDDPHQQ